MAEDIVKPTFDAEQQAVIDQIVKDAQGRAAREVRAQLDELKSKFSELQTVHEDLKVKAAKTAPKPGDETVESVKAQMEEIMNAHKELNGRYSQETERAKTLEDQLKKAKDSEFSTRKVQALQTAASKYGFLKMDLVLKDTADSVSFDNGEWVVLGPKGEARRNANLDPMTLEEFYAEYATKNPFLVRAGITPGSGSTESNGKQGGKYKLEDLFGKDSNGKLANDLALSNKPEYMRLRALAKEKGLI